LEQWIGLRQALLRAAPDGRICARQTLTFMRRLDFEATSLYLS